MQIDWDYQDSLVHSLWPRDGPFDREEAFEVNTSAHGDCLPYAVSCIVYGTEHCAREIRIRMMAEAILHRDWCLDHNNLAVNLADLHMKYTSPEPYALFLGSAATDYNKAYDLELVWCFSTYEYCGLSQMHQCALIIGRLIISVLPEFEDVKDEAPLHYYHNSMLYPKIEEDRSNVPMIVMWTKASPLSTHIASCFVLFLWVFVHSFEIFFTLKQLDNITKLCTYSLI